MIEKILLPITLLALTTTITNATGNKIIYSFNKAKKNLERSVYQDHRETLYCVAKFDGKKNVLPAYGFITSKYQKRAKRIEWEHVVPAENFGRAFKEWRKGHSQCVSSKGKHFKGRKCAEKISKQYRLMQSDMYNLFPAIGAVNALRSNYNFSVLPSAKSNFGSCQMKIEDRKVEPPINARGRIARSYLYMDIAYSKFKLSRQQRQLMTAWDKMYPVNKWECERSRRIKKIQGNDNRVVMQRCKIARL
ncbi:Endonuclease I precursor [Moritella sp. JT01]|uniref:endonuclease n=1 Tax=Moritella sp. JT01 TaxID=756698 RepID=UPI000792B93C|nr:endonuclease [Moritella sp. JT01]KXO13305.1 Endonuclease I precursor [Moritella sp. JT01]